MKRRLDERKRIFLKKVIIITLLSLLNAGLITGIILSLILKFQGYEIVSSLCTLIVGIVLPYFITYCVNNIVHPWYQTFNYLLRKKAIHKDEKVRVSYAILFKIEVGKKYFLVRDEHQISSFKVPSGTYRISEEEKAYCNKMFCCEEDDKYGYNIEKNDYRLFISVKHLKKFYKRFRSVKQDTANDIFERRIINEGKLPKELFGNAQLDYLGEDIVIKYPKYFSNYEMVLADIYQLKVTEKQKEYLIKMIEDQKPFKHYDYENLPKYYFATREEIISRGVAPVDGLPRPWIADHTYKIFRDLPPRQSYTEY